ncbi:MAG: hypothetical protein ACTHKM_00435 [Tsuneonella sp.]
MLESYNLLRTHLQTVAFFALAFAAWRWGGGPERATAAILIWFRLADWSYHGVFQQALDLTNIDLAHALIDFVAGIAAFAIALLANRIYSLWFAAAQLLAVLAHIARMLAVAIHPIAYAVMIMAPSYLQILLLAGGLWAHHRRVKRFGPYRSWRLSSNPLPVRARAGWRSG